MPEATPDAEFSGMELGSLLVSLLDPVRGDEVAFNRWYERDHFYAGCMVGPGFFAGRRFVATRALKDLRYPPTTPLFDDVRRGSYLSLFFIAAGQHAEAERWAVRQVHWLHEQGRMHPGRTQAHAGFYRHRWSVPRDADGVPAALALDHPFDGFALMMIDRAVGVSVDELDAWYRSEHLPGALAGGPAAMCLCFDPLPLPDDAPSYVPRSEGAERRSLHLYPLEDAPERVFRDRFAGHGDLLRRSGLGDVIFAAPFAPTVPGTDRYADALF